VPTETYAALLDQVLKGALPSAQSAEIASGMLSNGAAGTKITLLRALSPIDNISNQLLPQIKKLADDANTRDDVRAAAQAALARLGVTDYTWKEFVEKAIESAGNGADLGPLMEVLRALPPATVLERVEPALKSTAPATVRGAARVGAALGPQAVAIVSRLWHLRDDRNPSVRYGAVLALLEINPLTPDLSDHLKRLLVNRYYDEAEERSIQWGKTVAAVDLTKDKLGELRKSRLAALLARH
jgi:hypothetical protein